MRTTVRLDAQLLSAAREHASKTGRTLTALLEDALRTFLTLEGRPLEMSHHDGCGHSAWAGYSRGLIWITVPTSWISWKDRMQRVDVNVLVYAHRKDALDHGRHALD